MSFKSIVKLGMQSMVDPAEEVILFAAHQGYLKAISDLKKLNETSLIGYNYVIELLEEKFNKQEEE